MELKDAVELIGHSCRQREFLRIAGYFALHEPWTQDDVNIVLRARTFNPGVAARQITGGRWFLYVAGELGLAAPWTEEKIDAIKAAHAFNAAGDRAARRDGSERKFLSVDFVAVAEYLGMGPGPYYQVQLDDVRDAITPYFPGITSEAMAARLEVGVNWIRRKARDFGYGKLAPRGCFIIEGKRVRRAGISRYFAESDIPLLLAVLPDDAHTYELRVAKSVYRAANAAAQTSGDPLKGPSEVLEGWLEDGAQRVEKTVLAV